MAKFRKKLIVIEATQWFGNGDHPEDACTLIEDSSGVSFLSEGKIVRRFRRPDRSGNAGCSHCEETFHYHGWIDTKEGGRIVCPGDWIITGVQGERYPCKPDIFSTTYELCEEGKEK